MSPEDNAKIAKADTPIKDAPNAEQLKAALTKALVAETPADIAERLASNEPDPGTPERERAIRSHVKRVAEMATIGRGGKTPAEIQRILNMAHPECDCDNPQPKHAHKTVICGNCGGICVHEAAAEMKTVIADSIRQRAETTPNPDDYPDDVLGRKPVLFNKGARTPIKCMRCEAEGKLVYAGFAQKSRQIYCPTGKHTKVPREARFTSRFMRRKKTRAKA